MKEIVIQKGKLKGEISAPSSKSDTHRALILAGLTKGKSKIFNPLICDDTLATIDCLRELGIEIKKKKNFLEVEGKELKKPKKPLFCRESGTSLRLMTAVCALVKEKCILTGRASLMKRPITPLLDALADLGVKARKRGNFVIIEDNFVGGKTKLRGDISSQFISGLLLIPPLAKKEVEIKLTTPLESKPYVLMTISAQKKFGVKVNYSKNLRKFWLKRQNYKPTNYVVEGDWSSASPFLVAGILAGRVGIENLNLKSQQADKKIIDVLKKMGGKVIIKRDLVSTEKSELRPIKFNVKDCPDLFPSICILAAKARGKSEISGIERLKLKESNRLEEIRQGLNKMGIIAYLKKNRLFIKGGKPEGGVIDSRDHRIAMAFAILGLIAEGKTIIKNPGCVSKSFPTFFEELKRLL